MMSLVIGLMHTQRDRLTCTTVASTINIHQYKDSRHQPHKLGEDKLIGRMVWRLIPEISRTVFFHPQEMRRCLSPAVSSLNDGLMMAPFYHFAEKVVARDCKTVDQHSTLR